MVSNLDMGFYTALILSAIYNVSGYSGRASWFTLLAFVLLMIDVYGTVKGMRGEK